MDSRNSPLDLDSRKPCKQQIGSTERSVQFWGEARGECRKISVARLKCAQHSDAAQTLAWTIWERMTPEHYKLLSEIDKLLTAHEEIRVATLRETLGKIFEAVNVDVKDLRTIHNAPIEALTLLLNHVMKIYNTLEFGDDDARNFFPVSTRIDQMVTKAEELGLGHIEISKNMYVSERAKLAMLEKQIMGRLKLKSLTNEKDQEMGYKAKKETNRYDTIKRLKTAIAIKEKLKIAQLGQLSKSKSIHKKGDSLSSASLSIQGDSEIATETNPNEDECLKETTIDTSKWVISSTHEYFFGSAPPVIPTATVTHEVYPKPIDSKMMEDPELSQNLVETAENQSCLLDGTSCLEEGEEDSSSKSAHSISTHEEFINFEESQGDASTIFAWTEPEKTNSFCMSTYEKNIEADGQESEAAGDGCELARTKEESCIATLAEEQEDIWPTNSTTHLEDLTTDNGVISGTSSGTSKKNLFSCNEDQIPAEAGDFLVSNDEENFDKNDDPGCEISTEDTIEVKIENEQTAGLISDEPETSTSVLQEHTTRQETFINTSPVKEMAEAILQELTVEISRRHAEEHTSNVTATASGVDRRENYPNTNMITEDIEVVAQTGLKDSEKSHESSAVLTTSPGSVDVKEKFSATLTHRDSSHKPVDEFKSAHDFRCGTQVLYLRPTYHRPRLGKPQSPRIPDKSDEENDSSSPRTQGAEESSVPSVGKRNDRRTLAALAFALGLGTLGYMTFSGNGSVFPEMLSAAGGKAMNIIERALQVLRALNSRQ